ncbi:MULTISPECIES: hypothetical protein [Haloferax]|uniref:Lipoprotein n=1 Tax=Haloferax marinum TaxID=2666143 RepID=A0A6A8G914_9EURY|nr:MULTISPECIES: hypothetical protein [Haloferax]KAB1197986.1 hypothetical protein Hfx1150_10830 [Haloferax sp. CBA1150]MRW97052.1 hypothetical protein [Haloferax marinum]
MVGSVSLAVGVAGCSSSSGGADGGNQEANTASDSTPKSTTSTPTPTETETQTETASADFGDSEETETPTEKGKNPAATDEKGTVATDKQADGLTFVDHYHYTMNGLQGVAGVVENESDTEFETVTVHATVEPGDAGPYSRDLKWSLPAGETQRFQFKFGDDAPETVESYTIWATGKK